MYHRLLQPSAAALQTLALAPKDLGGYSGLVGGLHPWTRALASHPPSHSLVPGGALASDGLQGRSPRAPDWRVPVPALSRLCRGKFRAALPATECLPSVPPQVWTKGWMTPGPPAGTGAEVLSSFAPDIHRVASTTNRLAARENGAVPCRYTAHSRNQWTHRTLPAKALIRRLLQHVLPQGCSTVRSYGSLRPSRRTALTPIRLRLATGPRYAPAPVRGQDRERQATLPAPAEAEHCSAAGGRWSSWCVSCPPKEGHHHDREGDPSSQAWSHRDRALTQAYSTRPILPDRISLACARPSPCCLLASLSPTGACPPARRQRGSAALSGGPAATRGSGAFLLFRRPSDPVKLQRTRPPRLVQPSMVWRRRATRILIR
jgi:Putative transposase